MKLFKMWIPPRLGINSEAKSIDKTGSKPVLANGIAIDP